MNHQETPTCECHDCYQARTDFVYELVEANLSRETKIKLVGYWLHAGDTDPDEDEIADLFTSRRMGIG